MSVSLDHIANAHLASAVVTLDRTVLLLSLVPRLHFVLVIAYRYLYCLLYSISKPRTVVYTTACSANSWAWHSLVDIHAQEQVYHQDKEPVSQETGAM